MPLPGSTASSADCTAGLEHSGAASTSPPWASPGTGESDRLPVWPNDWWERGAAQAAALAAHLGAARFAVMGASAGGIVALLTALRDPERGAAVVAVSCGERLIASDLERVVRERGPATRTDAHGFRRAADDLLAAARF